MKPLLILQNQSQISQSQYQKKNQSLNQHNNLQINQNHKVNNNKVNNNLNKMVRKNKEERKWILKSEKVEPFVGLKFIYMKN